MPVVVNQAAAPMLTRQQLMRRWGIGTTAMWKLEQSGKGPTRTMIGLSVRYALVDVEEYERQHRQPGKAA